jgi:hypothetical protein
MLGFVIMGSGGNDFKRHQSGYCGRCGDSIPECRCSSKPGCGGDNLSDSKAAEDLFDTPTCTVCASGLEHVRPGKWQCNFCDMDAAFKELRNERDKLADKVERLTQEKAEIIFKLMQITAKATSQQ